METPLDQHLTRSNDPYDHVEYAGFGPRLGALLLDGLILVPITVVILFNMFLWKNPAIFVLATLVNLCYKPFMEFKFGSTLGKMIVRIKVVNARMEAPGIQEALLRNVFHILFVLITLFSTLWLFGLPDFGDVETFRDYSFFVKKHDDYSLFTTYLPGLLTLVDGIIMLTDVFKRSLHDRIGKTYVVKY